MLSPQDLGERFCHLDFHDDTLVDVKIFPARRRNKVKDSTVEIQLYRDDKRKLRLVRFGGCTNLRVAMDFDVLAEADSNTSSVSAHTEADKMRRLILSQKKDWHLEYSPPESSPLPKKLELLETLVFFRVQFFGGVVDVIASEYQVTMAIRRFRGRALKPRARELIASPMAGAARFGRWQVEFDRQETVRRYSRLPDSACCSCPDCENFKAAAKRVFPTGFLDITDQLGIHISKPAELWHYGKDETGHHLTGGLFYIVGRLVSGEDAWKPTDHNWVAPHFEKLSSGAEFGFMHGARPSSASPQAIHRSFKGAALVQMEFMIHVPRLSLLRSRAMGR